MDRWLIAQASPWGYWRDWFFQVYQVNCILIFGSVAWLVILCELRRNGRIVTARDRWLWSWLVGGATAMGLGIWAMHYIGMLALRLSVGVLYDVPTVIASLLAAIGASAVVCGPSVKCTLP